ncbi:Uncharacterised protein [Vibrio cholerae]|uniref:Uncharacterized protein n=1 Tax=Vibrio cholerae TaxID=666 RepID=A0A656AIF0_VIBCL|nr:Uncharacterised protein [Vibrio cholerae]CSD11562.1 Uncharacterised protein [Vibrio cholerae]
MRAFSSAACFVSSRAPSLANWYICNAALSVYLAACHWVCASSRFCSETTPSL